MSLSAISLIILMTGVQVLEITDNFSLNKDRGSQSIKIDVRKSFDKSISIDKLILNNIDFIGQSIKIDTHTPMKC